MYQVETPEQLASPVGCAAEPGDVEHELREVQVYDNWPCQVGVEVEGGKVVAVQ